jgi:flavin reductase (DIM6/NTAB) family NADH-FMN oxidoreductase RutF
LAVAPDAFRNVLGHFATGVTVVAYMGPAGVPGGLTVNSFSSLSLRPPLVMVCIDHTAESFEPMMAADSFAVNFLSIEQEDVSRRFATKSVPLYERFTGLAWHPGARRGAPILDGALAHLECAIVDRHGAGDHTIVVGEVLDAGSTEGEPLLFYRGHYGEWSPKAPPAARSVQGA